MRVRAVPGDDAPGLPARGRVNTAVAVIPLPWLALDRPAVRVRWAGPLGALKSRGRRG